ncbi:uncharacterized protein LOC106714093 [Papilio machaon]|uniref:uncharacterized protein LOC106714093 n=1 Tax=Papilio machaon TaxID=76193 RepID=UPI001E662FFE|nr:uncharacterized protein LOC106714093 [Papilio machaon]
MRARAVTVAFALCFYFTNALQQSSSFTDQRLSKLLACNQALGPMKCLTAFSAWRARRAVDLITNHQRTFEVNVDLDQFPWEKYANQSEEQVYSDLCDGTESLLRFRKLDLDFNDDYTLRLGSKGNGTLNVDVIKSDGDTGRGYMKKMKKKFLNIIPLLLVPGLIMSAILPFVLPALKMMVIAVGILNNMALSGAVFTLLRNNAFNEANQHRIIYVNEGYHNEKHYPIPTDLHHYSASSDIISELAPPGGENILLTDNTGIKDANLPWIDNRDITSHVYYTDTKVRRKGHIPKETVP